MPKKILIVTGNKPEHFALIDALMETGSLCGAVLQTDSEEKDLNGNLKKYYEGVLQSVHKFFGVKYSHTSNLKTKPVSRNKINDGETIDFINSLAADLLINFGTENFTSDNLKKIKCEKWKIHSGDPEYFRGYDCNFWAAYLLKPEHIRHTIYVMEDDPWHGDIVHKSSTAFRGDDTVQDMDMRSFRRLVNDMPSLVKKYQENRVEYKKSASLGLFFDKGSISEKHAGAVYDYFGNRFENMAAEAM